MDKFNNINLLDITSDDEYFMLLAIKESLKAYEIGEVPVGAVAVKEGKVIARAYNQIEKLKDATAHAEMLLITQVSSYLGDWRLNDVTIYVTKEPCPMCAGAMVNAKLGKLIYGMKDPKYGAAGTALDITNFPTALHKVDVLGGFLEDKCLEIFQSFFRELRKENISRP
ncbi:MAG TPA: tRNA-specific adenosine deaminase [Lentisphaeria bacterium]|nr:MAG: tRNA-specific adenosine deaminase [Lentisphaerae bacterium GWF2_38_69]HBM17456.1 tRNA-specific adenosine deaminase [Lentisphaeria bacterium]